MLDSTGYERREKVQCFMCERVCWEFQAYTPQVGHCGEELNVGTCIENGFGHEPMKNWKGSKLFKIAAHTNHLRTHFNTAEYVLQCSHEPHHYRGYRMPDFGHYLGQTVWVCADCVAFYEAEAVKNTTTLAEIIDAAVWDEIQSDYGNVSGMLFTRGVLTLKNGRACSFRSLPSGFKDYVEKTIIKLYNAVSHINPESTHPGAAKNIKKLYRLFDPKKKRVFVAAKS